MCWRKGSAEPKGLVERQERLEQDRTSRELVLGWGTESSQEHSEVGSAVKDALVFHNNPFVGNNEEG
jgi:hypothetical protein